MKKGIKKITYCLVLSMFLLIFISNISAATVGLSINKSSAYVGESFSVNISGINGKVTITSSSNVTLSVTGTQWVDGSMSITGTTKSVGNATITVTPVDATTTSAEPEVVDKANSVTIAVKEKTQTDTTQTATTTTNNNTQTNTTNKAATTNTNNNTAQNNNAYLSKLQVNQEGLTPNFNKTKTNYSITVGENVSSLKVTATPEVSTSKVSITGNNDLKNGDNKIYITVTAQDGTKKVYTITVTKTADAVKSNSYLESLIVENATLSPEFSKEIFEYDCGTVGASVENLKILTFGENENVKVEITGNDKLVEGENTITVKVTSEDGTTTKEYIIKVKKDSSLVEENVIEEINSLKDTDDDSISGFQKFLNNLKSNWLLILMYIVIIVEFVEIVYLYRHQERKNKTNIKNTDILNKKEVQKSTDKNITLDKEFKQKRKLRNSEEKNENLNNAKKRNGAMKFDE